MPSCPTANKYKFPVGTPVCLIPPNTKLTIRAFHHLKFQEHLHAFLHIPLNPLGSSSPQVPQKYTASISKQKFHMYLFSTYWEKMIQQFLIQLTTLFCTAIQNVKLSWYNPSAFVSQSVDLWHSCLTDNDALFSSCTGDLVGKMFSFSCFSHRKGMFSCSGDHVQHFWSVQSEGVEEGEFC